MEQMAFPGWENTQVSESEGARGTPLQREGQPNAPSLPLRGGDRHPFIAFTLEGALNQLRRSRCSWCRGIQDTVEVALRKFYHTHPIRRGRARQDGGHETQAPSS